MNVVFLPQRVPWPPDRGDRISTWNLLRHLLGQGAKVRVGCFREEPRDDQAVEHLRTLCTEVVAPRIHRGWRKLTSLRGLLTGEALTLPFFRHAELSSAVTRWCASERIDLMLAYSSSMAQYLLTAPATNRVVHFAELDSDKWRQYAEHSRGLGKWVYAREHRQLLRFEQQAARQASAALVVSDVEKELFERAIPGAHAHVVRNGVDVAHFRSAGDSQRHAHTLIFTGVMDYAPNIDAMVWFVANCWPTLKTRFPDARLLIVGSKPTPAVRALMAQPGITVTGRVDTTPPWFDQAAVAIAPLRLARGVQNKVLEAMSMGLPVVATPAAAQGLGRVPDGMLAAADSAADQVAAISQWLSHKEQARQAGLAAAHWIRAHWQWPQVLAEFDAVLAGLAAR